MPMVLQWRVIEPPIITRWRGPLPSPASIEQHIQNPVAGIIGPPGPIGPVGAPARIDVTAAATWILSHDLGRVPLVQVFLASGELVVADVVADDAHVTVTFPTATAGFVLIA